MCGRLSWVQTSRAAHSQPELRRPTTLPGLMIGWILHYPNAPPLNCIPPSLGGGCRRSKRQLVQLLASPLPLSRLYAPCYIFNALFRDTSLAYLLSRCVCHICHVTCVTCVTYVTCQVSRKVGKWGIPEKSIKNAAQRR